MNLRRSVYIILPTSVVWLITALFLLVYVFELLEITFKTESNFTLTNPGFILLFITAVIATLALYTTGQIIDQKPEIISILIIIALLGSAISLIAIILGIDYILFLILGLPSLGLFLGILATSAGAIFSSYSQVHNRGRLYSNAIFFSAIFSIVTIPLIGILNQDFRFHLFLISGFSILMALCFYIISRTELPWHNDIFPTPLTHIINRRPVKAFLLAHFFLYLMIGIAITNISHLGLDLGYPDLQINMGFYKFTIGQSTLFWFLVFLGDMIFVLPMGWLSDKLGRKNLIVVGCYLIMSSILIVALSQNNPFMYYCSAFILGASFASYHPSIDSAVWADLSPLDSVGRYNALGFIFLLQGIGVGLAVGLFIRPWGGINTISYILIGFAVLGLLPLFFVSDSYEPLDLYLLLVSRTGILVFNYDFKREKEISKKDLTLISGALSAISTIFEVTLLELETESTLDLVQHGNIFIVQARVSTSKGYLIGTIFANKNDPELQKSLELFLLKFAKSYKTELETWIGQLGVFKNAINIAEDVFGSLIPSKTLSKDYDDQSRKKKKMNN